MSFVKTTLAVALGVTIPMIGGVGLMFNKRFMKWFNKKTLEVATDSWKEEFGK